MHTPRISRLIGAAIGSVLVVLSLVSNNPGWGFFSHTVCDVSEPLGNFTVWVPNAVVASPYHGSVSGSVVVWSRYPWGTAHAQLNYTPVTNGSVTAFIVGFENWTVYSVENATVVGPGPIDSCNGPMVAYPSSNPAQGLRHGGTSMWPLYHNLSSDTGLAPGLNGSQLCAQVENTSYADCGVGAQFNISFEKVSGTINTCGSLQNRVLPVFSQQWPVTAPYPFSGHTYSVPLDLTGLNSANYANGTYAWYNYTFPANGGIWQYDDLSQTSLTGAGLAFMYSPCP